MTFDSFIECSQLPSAFKVVKIDKIVKVLFLFTYLSINLMLNYQGYILALDIFPKSALERCRVLRISSGDRFSRPLEALQNFTAKCLDFVLD